MLLLDFQGYLDRLTNFDMYLKSTTTPTIDMKDITLTTTEIFQWIFSGLNVNISQCSIDSLSITVQSFVWSNEPEQIQKTATIMIHNSSFGNLELNPGVKAQIIQCHIDAKFKDRPTLITANNSDLSIQKCHFENFRNEKGSTILFGHNNSHVTIENSVFIQHNSSKGVLLLQHNSSICISGSTMSQNVVFTLSYSAISLQDGVHAVMNSTVLRNNSALAGGAVNAQDKCQVTLANCTFSSNKAITDKILNIQKNHKVEIPIPAVDNNNIESFTPINHVLLNKTLLHGDETGIFTAHRILPLNKSFILKEKSEQQVGLLAGIGGAVGVAVQSQLLVTNCTFENNSAQTSAGAIGAALNVKLNIQGTTFVGNKALAGGAIVVEHQAYMRINNCAFEENVSEMYGGAISGDFNSTLNFQETTFARNTAFSYGGAIIARHQTHLQIKNCAFNDNMCIQVGGAILGAFNTRLIVQETTFVGNKALLHGGAIDVQQQVHIRIDNCMFEENTSEQLGGAIIIVLNSLLDMQDTHFTGNRAVKGGAVQLNTATYLHATSCVFENNHAKGFGGALAGGIEAVLEVERSHFLKNSASLAGAIFASSNVTLDIQETKFVGNKALSDSGAFLVKFNANLQITKCVFEDNISQRVGGTGGGTDNATLDIRDTNFTGNSTLQGGAIDVDKQSFLQVVNCMFEDNHAGLGGALFGGLDLVCIIIGSYFLNNRASQGGAINVQQKATVLITNSRLEYNFVDNGLGGGMVAQHVKLEIRETNFTGNRASNQGGALFMDSQSQCHVIRCMFHGNTASTSGGAVGMGDASSLIIENTDFTNNNSSDGGAIYSQYNSKLQMKMCIFWKNFAKQSGGSIILDKNSSAMIESCSFLINYAVSGGAIYLNSPQQVSLTDTFLLQNMASSDGGAISISDGTNININNITCYGNSGAMGGCLYTQSVILTLNNSSLRENSGLQFAADIYVHQSRMQVCFEIIRYFIFQTTTYHLRIG